MNGSCDSGEGDSYVLKLQFQFALEHFMFHARQRTTMFHFFLISFGVLTNAIVLLIKETLFVPAGIIAIVGAIISLGFVCLDCRNKHLVKYSEHVLKFLEEKKLFKGETYEGVTLGFILREDLERETKQEKSQKWLKHSFWIPLIQCLALVVFLGTAGVAFFAPEAWLTKQISKQSEADKAGTVVEFGEPQNGSQRGGS